MPRQDWNPRVPRVTGRRRGAGDEATTRGVGSGSSKLNLTGPRVSSDPIDRDHAGGSAGADSATSPTADSTVLPSDFATNALVMGREIRDRPLVDEGSPIGEVASKKMKIFHFSLLTSSRSLVSC